MAASVKLGEGAVIPAQQPHWDPRWGTTDVRLFDCALQYRSNASRFLYSFHMQPFGLDGLAAFSEAERPIFSVCHHGY